MMFGEVGGLHDFLALGLSTVLAFFSERQLMASLAQKLFHGAPNVTKKRDEVDNTIRHTINFNPLSFSANFVVAQSFIMSCCYRDKTLRRKALFDGISRVEDSLDVVKLVRSHRALATLLRLLLTKDERRLIRL